MSVGQSAHRKHFISFVKNKHLHIVGLEHTTLDHILDTTRRTNDDLGTILKSLHILAHICTTNAWMAFNVHKVTNGDHDFLDLLGQFSSWGENQSLASLELRVDLLENRDGEGSCLASSRLCLGDHIRSCAGTLVHKPALGEEFPTFDDGHDGTLLNSRWALETICIDTFKTNQSYFSTVFHIASYLAIARSSDS